MAETAQERSLALLEWVSEEALTSSGVLELRQPVVIDPAGGGWALHHRRMQLLQVCIGATAKPSRSSV